jgi:hypothetical protein
VVKGGLLQRGLLCDAAQERRVLGMISLGGVDDDPSTTYK